jgi:hypothetical protein
MYSQNDRADRGDAGRSQATTKVGQEKVTAQQQW